MTGKYVNGLQRSSIVLKGWMVLKGCQSSSKAFKVQRGPYWFRKVLQVLERSWIALRRTSNEIKHVEWKKKDLTSYKVCKVMTQSEEFVMVLKGRGFSCPKKSPERYWKILKRSKMSWNVRKCSRISKISFNSADMECFAFLFLLTKQHFRPGTGPKKFSDQFFSPKKII